MARRAVTEGDSRELDFSDLIYRSNIFILENDTFGNLQASYRAIDYLERLLAPFQDPQYMKDIEQISKLESKRGRNQNEVSQNKETHVKLIMDLKHEALMRLAFRNGYLGNKKLHSQTGIMEEGMNEQIL
jgi:hypothetical protein